MLLVSLLVAGGNVQFGGQVLPLFLYYRPAATCSVLPAGVGFSHLLKLVVGVAGTKLAALCWGRLLYCALWPVSRVADLSTELSTVKNSDRMSIFFTGGKP